MGDWLLSPASDLTSAQLREGLRGLEQDMAPGPKERISAAIMEMIGATDRPPQLDEEKAAARIIALRNMAWDYPVDVVELACRNWRRVPNFGRWWPAEQDLRAQCEPLVDSRRRLRGKVMRMLGELETIEEQEERARRPSPFTGDKFKRFRDEMEKRMRPARFDAYFHRSEMLFKGDNTMLVRCSTAETVLRNEGADLLREMGLRVVYCPQSFLNEKLRPFEPTSPEEKEEIVRKLKLMFKAMGAGADIAAMRREGTL